MYKIIVVDDDSIIRKGLSQAIDWNAHGLFMAGTAKNGEEGLELVDRLQPHIVITDIRMPFMDGLIFTEIVKSKYPDIKIIMLTSYNEFEFAKKALQLKVFEYFLKPIDNELLVETVKKAVVEIEKENSLRMKVVQALPLLRVQFLEKWIGGQANPEEIVENCDFFQIQHTGRQYAVIVIKADDYSYPDYQNRFGKALLKYSIVNVAEETARDKQVLLFDSMEDQIVAICLLEPNLDSLDQHIYELAEAVRMNVECYMKTTVTIGIGGIYACVHEVATSFQDACLAFEYRHILGKNRVITVGDTGVMPVGEEFNGSSFQHTLIANIKLGIEEEAHALLSQMEQSIIAAKTATISKVRLIGMEIIIILHKEIEMPTEDCEIDKLYQQLVTMTTVAEIFGMLRLVIHQFITHIRSQRERQMKQLIYQVTDYIDRNYAVEGLSLQDVAHAIHISPTYLSAIFKKERNINFTDYLLQTRMNAAIELLRTTGLKTYEVAERVGFKYVQYFSVCFKKHTGKSPTEYRN